MDDPTSVGTDRLKSLLTWWGMPAIEDKDSVSSQLNRFQTFVSDVQKAYFDAASRQMEAMFAANDRLARSAQGLLHGQKPADLLSTQAEITTVVLDVASLNAGTWAEFQQKVQDSIAALSRETAEKVSAEPQPKAAQEKPERSATRASEKLVDA